MKHKLTFSDHGKLTSSETLARLKAKIPVRRITVIEPHTKHLTTYLALPARKVFDLIYGKRWRHTQEVLFTCADGYQPSVPVRYFLHSKAYFAFAKTRGKPFTLNNVEQNEKNVPLAPLYLVWANRHDASIRAVGSSIWPYKITAFDLVNFADRFPKMAIAANAPSPVVRGFLYFRAYCTSCHRINGEGGKKAQDLTHPVNVTDQHSAEWLERFISDPNKVIKGIHMAPFNQAVTHRNRAIRDVITYLEYMKTQK